MATNTVLRSLHDLGLASWFGGSLMGATGLRVAALAGDDPLADRTDREADGWDAWMPVAVASITAHAVGGIGLIVVNRGRHRRQREVLPLTLVKAAVTGLALASTAGQGVLGRRLAELQHAADDGDTQAQERSEQLRRQVRALGVATPLLTGTLVVLASREGELQRASETVAGTAAVLADKARAALGHARDTVVDELPDRSAVAERLTGLAASVRDRLDDAGVSDALGQVKEIATERVRELTDLENLKDLKESVLDRTGLAA